MQNDRKLEVRGLGFGGQILDKSVVLALDNRLVPGHAEPLQIKGNPPESFLCCRIYDAGNRLLLKLQILHILGQLQFLIP
ncbi:hypothetical protein D3C73_1312650 [compost metagenome]